MDESTRRCRYCGKPADQHFMEVLPDGTPSMSVWKDTKKIRCTQSNADAEYFRGRIQALQTVVRSLRNRAGRLLRQGTRWDDDDLRRYSDHWVDDLERTQRSLLSIPIWRPKRK